MTTQLAPRQNTAVALPGSFSLTDLLAGGGKTYRRISIRGNVFREVVNGDEVFAYDSRTLPVVILGATPVGRNFYEGAYKEGEKSKPKCWSFDGKVPAADVIATDRQAPSCNSCKQNIKGSGSQADSRACKFQQRIAVGLVDNGRLAEKEVFQLAVPAQSIFGDAENGQMPLQAYARYLQSKSTDIRVIVTEIKMDTNSATPKLFFRALRPLNEEELQDAVAMMESQELVDALTNTVAQQDGAAAEPVQEEEVEVPATAGDMFDDQPAPKPAAKAATKPAPKAEPADMFSDQPVAAPAAAKPATARRAAAPRTKPVQEEAVAEPTKMASKPASAAPADTADLASLVASWDNE